MNEYMLRVQIKTNVVMWNNSGRKCWRFSEEYPKCGRFYKTMPPFYHKRRTLPANNGRLECIWPKMQCKILFTLIFCTVKKTFLIFRGALVIFHNPFHCRYKEFIILTTVYFLLHCPPYSIFLCVCNINFEEKLLYSMMLNSQLVPLVITI